MVFTEQVVGFVAGRDSDDGEGVSNTNSMSLSTSFCLSSVVSCCCGSSSLSLFANVVGRYSALSLFGV